MRSSVWLIVVVAVISTTGSSQTFKQHKIGETPEQFFSIATTSGKGMLTKTYCNQYLTDPKVSKAYEKAQRNVFDTKAMLQSIDVKGCRQVQHALDGKDAEVGARYAAELRGGSVTFYGSRLAMMVFDLKKGTLLEDVVTDISKELGEVEPVLSTDTVQNAFGATLQKRKALWNTKTLTVAASEMKDFRYGDLGISVIVADSEYFKQKEAERQANRPSTIK